MPAAMDRAAPAYLGSWALTLRTVAEVVEAHSWESFIAMCPSIRDSISQAEQVVVDAGGGQVSRPDWIACFQEPKGKLQGEMGKHISAEKRVRVLRSLPEDKRALFRPNGGIGAGALLLPPRSEDIPVMPDKHFEVIARDRHGLPVSTGGALCQHRRANGSRCSVSRR